MTWHSSWPTRTLSLLPRYIATPVDNYVINTRSFVNACKRQHRFLPRLRAWSAVHDTTFRQDVERGVWKGCSGRAISSLDEDAWPPVG